MKPPFTTTKWRRLILATKCEWRSSEGSDGLCRSLDHASDTSHQRARSRQSRSHRSSVGDREWIRYVVILTIRMVDVSFDPGFEIPDADYNRLHTIQAVVDYSVKRMNLGDHSKPVVWSPFDSRHQETCVCDCSCLWFVKIHWRKYAGFNCGWIQCSESCRGEHRRNESFWSRGPEQHLHSSLLKTREEKEEEKTR